MRLELTGHPSDPAAAWEVVTDTDWMNREAGNGRVLAMAVEPDPHGYPEIRGALEGPLGVRLPFVESGNHWVRGRHFHQRREYSSGPLRSSLYEVHMDRSGGQAVPRLVLDLEPRTALFQPVVGPSLRRIGVRWQKVLDGLPEPGDREPAELRTLAPVAVDALARWQREVPSAIAERLRTHLVQTRPLELQRMRAFELADRWGEERDAVVAAFLAGAGSGLLELYWSVRCPRCESQTASTPHLGNLADHSTCASCRIGFDADLGENVEVLFAPHPSVVERVDESFCTLFPQSAPSIEASVVLEPGARWEQRLEVGPGRWRVGAGGDQPDVSIHAGPTGARQIAWTPQSDGDVEVAAGLVDVALHNDTTGRTRVQIARVDAGPPAVLASYLTTLPGFRRDMSHQVLAPDTRISTRSVSLLFSDLTGSTAMYEDLGDAAAYALVRDHFRVLRAAAEAWRGSIVKTIGDAVMAAFDEPGLATAAAIQMIRDFDRWVDTQGLDRPPRLKVGVHVGPALVVHTDASGLDYFGQTVNIAARTQGAADGGELLLTAETAGWSTVTTRLAEEGLRAEGIELRFKGVSAPVRLHRVVVGKSDSS